MPVIRVGVQAPQGSAGQVVDLDGLRANVASIANVSGESIAYSVNRGGTWTTLASGATASSVGNVEAGALRLRKVASSGGYPVIVDIDATVYGVAQSSLQPDQIASVQALVSTEGSLSNGALLTDQCPNTLVQDTVGSIGTTLSQVAFATIPGGSMGLRTRLGIGVVFDLGGSDSKDLRLFAGPASGTFATATSFGGLFGLTTQRYAPMWGLFYNENSRSAQRANVAGQGDWPRASTANPTVSMAIDTALDWNIYVGVKFNAATNGNTATLRNFWIHVIG